MSKLQTLVPNLNSLDKNAQLQICLSGLVNSRFDVNFAIMRESMDFIRVSGRFSKIS